MLRNIVKDVKQNLAQNLDKLKQQEEEAAVAEESGKEFADQAEIITMKAQYSWDPSTLGVFWNQKISLKKSILKAKEEFMQASTLNNLRVWESWVSKANIYVYQAKTDAPDQNEREAFLKKEAQLIAAGRKTLPQDSPVQVVASPKQVPSTKKPVEAEPKVLTETEEDTADCEAAIANMLCQAKSTQSSIRRIASFGGKAIMNALLGDTPAFIVPEEYLAIKKLRDDLQKEVDSRWIYLNKKRKKTKIIFLTNVLKAYEKAKGHTSIVTCVEVEKSRLGNSFNTVMQGMFSKRTNKLITEILNPENKPLLSKRN